MLRKYCDCNNSVTNVQSGSKPTIVKSGHQKHHYQNRAKFSYAHAHAAHGSRPGANKRTDKLEKAGLLLLAGILVIITTCVRAESWAQAGSKPKRAESYPLCGIVEAINYEEDYITIVDNSGNAWEWEGTEDWQENDIAAMIMNDNGTEEIMDDTIVSIRYTGWVE